MAKSVLSVSIALLVAVICSVHCEETAHENAIHSAQQAHKLMTLNRPAEDEDGLLLTDDGFVEAPIPEDYLDKRGSLFRFGKRQGSLFRFGKRGSLFRFGKRQGGTLFRFGKRGGGALFRFGRSGSDETPIDGSEDKRTLFRFGKRSDLDLLRNVLAQYEYGNSSPYLDGAENKRAIDSFHWGSDSEK